MKQIRLFVVLLMMAGLHAASQDNDPFSTDEEAIQKIMQNFCANAWPRYKEIDNWIKTHKEKPEVPVPPGLDPFCYECSGPKAKDQSEAKANAFIKKAVEPEASMISTLLEIARALALLGGGTGQASGNLPACMNQLTNDDLMEKAKWLVERVYYGKAVKMAEKYHRQPEMAYAGLRFLLPCAREYMLIGGSMSTDNEAMELAANWLNTYFNKFEDRLTKQYQYKLFPNFLWLPRQLALVNGGDPNNVFYSKLLEWTEKLTKFMHFKLKIEFEARGHGDNGAIYTAKVSGEAPVVCRLEQNGSCYNWEIENGGQMEFRVEEVIFKSDQGMAKNTDHDNFKTPVKLRVNMCADGAVMHVIMDQFGGLDESYVTNDGVVFNAPLLQGLAMATLGSSNLEQMKQGAEDLKAKAGQFKGQEADIDAAAKRLNEHRNDPNYLKTAQGKSDMAKMNQMAKAMGYDPNTIRPDQKRMQNLDNLKAYNNYQKSVNEKFTKPGYIGSAEYTNDQQQLARLRQKTDLSDLAQEVGLNISPLQVDGYFMNSKKLFDKIQRDNINAIAGDGDGWEYGQFHVTIEKD